MRERETEVFDSVVDKVSIRIVESIELNSHFKIRIEFRYLIHTRPKDELINDN